MPIEMLTRTSAAPPDSSGHHSEPDDEGLRKLALRQPSSTCRSSELYLSIYVLSMLVPTPVWIVTQYDVAGLARPPELKVALRGDWDPWLIWVALIGAVLVAIAGYRAYFDRPTTEADVDREVERLRSGG